MHIMVVTGIASAMAAPGVAATTIIITIMGTTTILGNAAIATNLDLRQYPGDTDQTSGIDRPSADGPP